MNLTKADSIKSGFRRIVRSSATTLGRLLGAGLLLFLSAGCVALDLDDLGTASPQLSSKILGEMAKKKMSPESPVLVRIFKRESELEIWKQDATGRYALLRTYPMCRWSGKLGPKTESGDRQAPEGFYHVSAGMLNPKSQYYLSFNLGYPNRLEVALGYSGEALMVHGACSSSGCYALTDQGVGEIYAIVQKALIAGQERFQVQAFPFRMTPETTALFEQDPNFAFWRNLKTGYDIFELTRTPPKVSACGRRYVFNVSFPDGEPRNALDNCPDGMSEVDPALVGHLSVADRKLKDALARGYATAVSSYVDGGMHPAFRKLLKDAGASALAARISQTKYPVSRPDAALADPFKGTEKFP